MQSPVLKEARPLTRFWFRLLCFSFSSFLLIDPVFTSLSIGDLGCHNLRARGKGSFLQ